MVKKKKKVSRKTTKAIHEAVNSSLDSDSDGNEFNLGNPSKHSTRKMSVFSDPSKALSRPLTRSGSGINIASKERTEQVSSSVEPGSISAKKLFIKGYINEE